MTRPKFDIAVIGAGTAGIPAALQAAAAGASTLLVEKNGMPGGTVTVAGISYPGIFHAWGRQVIAGIGWELVKRTRETSRDPLPEFHTIDMREHWIYQIAIDPVIFAALCEEELRRNRVDVRYHTMLGAVALEREGAVLTLCGKDGLYEVFARRVIDCTGDANAAVMAGAAVRTPSPCQPGTMSVYAIGYDPGALDYEAIGRAFDQAVQAGELSAEEAGWSKSFNPHFLHSRGRNSNHICGINAADSAGRTRMEFAGRESLLRMYRFLKRQPGLEQLEFKLGAAECGVRETRTIVGQSTVTAEEYLAGVAYPDAICHAFYPIDLHDAALGLDKRNLEQGVVPSVPRGALITIETPHLLAAGRILSSDRLANSALRVQAVCMATGQAAAALAVLSLRHDCPAEQLKMAEVRELLTRHGAIVP